MLCFLTAGCLNSNTSDQLKKTPQEQPQDLPIINNSPGTESIPIKKSLSDFSLKKGETKFISKELSLKFVDVIEDSRCAKDVQCIWEGRAIISATLTDRDKVNSIKLTLGEKQSNQWGVNFDDLVYKNSSEAQASFSISK